MPARSTHTTAAVCPLTALPERSHRPADVQHRAGRGGGHRLAGLHHVRGEAGRGQVRGGQGVRQRGWPVFMESVIPQLFSTWGISVLVFSLTDKKSAGETFFILHKKNAIRRPKNAKS